MVDEDRVQEIKDRLADRFTAAELCDLLSVPVEDIIEEYWPKLTKRPDILEEVGAAEVEEEEEPEEE